MWHVLFGTEKYRAYDIVKTIDKRRYRCDFGDLEHADLGQFDCVVPQVFSDYDALKSKMDQRGIKFWCPKPETVDLCDDKLALNKFLLGGAFAELVPPLLEKEAGRYPYILKKRTDENGAHAFVIRTLDDERAFTNLLDSPEYFCQTYVPGREEFAVHILYVHDEIAYAQTVKYEFVEKVYAKGQHFCLKRRTYLSNNDHLDAFAKILRSVEYTGTCCIDYKMQDGQPQILEINPRGGSSLPRDINRYLEAYLASLGIMQPAQFKYHYMRPTQDGLPTRAQMYLRAHLPDGVRRSIGKARRILRQPLSALGRNHAGKTPI